MAYQLHPERGVIRISDGRRILVSDLEWQEYRAWLKTLVDRITATRAGYLDHLNMAAGKIAAAEDTPLLDIPIAGGIVRGLYSAIGSSSTHDYDSVASHGAVVTSTSATSWQTAVDYTGAGVLELLAHSTIWSGASTTAYFELTIDGVLVVNTYATTGSGLRQGSVFHGSCMVAYDTSNNPTFSLICGGGIPFKSSLKIRHYVTNGSPASSSVFYRYRKTA